MGSGHGLVPNRTPLGCSRNAWPRLQIVQDQAAQLAWLLHRSSPWAANTTSRSQQAAKIRNMMSGSAVRKRTDCPAGRPRCPGAPSRRAVKGRGAMSAASLPLTDRSSGAKSEASSLSYPRNTGMNLLLSLVHRITPMGTLAARVVTGRPLRFSSNDGKRTESWALAIVGCGLHLRPTAPSEASCHCQSWRSALLRRCYCGPTRQAQQNQTHDHCKKTSHRPVPLATPPWV